MELTKEHFDQAVKGLSTQQSVDDLTVRVVAVEGVLGSHTITLDAIAKNTSNGARWFSGELWILD